MTDATVRRGSRRKRWAILVTPIPPERYPDYCEDPDHRFASMDPAQRIAEIDAMCARLWLKKEDVAECPTVASATTALAA